MKTPTATLLLLAAAASLGAQQPPANPITAAFRGRITGLSHNIEQGFDSIPESIFGYKPTPAQLSIGYIAQHVADDNYVFCNGFGALKADIPADARTTPDSVKATWPKAKLVEQLRASFAFCDKAMDQVTDASLAGETTLTYGGRSRSISRTAMVLGHALDLADHYSQLANYMRLNGILPPTALPRPGRGGM
ncbi:MAG: DinB family protein [Gemmatimonadota bacterium]|nr:DinB family protein [Gemmatimonadota bacterium]MDE3172661.1 DinB family protein [Gemmatimonadota bacterium]MDE3215802.1 DinB family protein [Gemmatimonadota bacterium]